MDSLRLERTEATDRTPGLERHEPDGGKQPRRKVVRREAEDLGEEEKDTDDDSSPEETEQHTFDTRA